VNYAALKNFQPLSEYGEADKKVTQHVDAQECSSAAQALIKSGICNRECNSG
jgi:hypothetical protein